MKGNEEQLQAINYLNGPAIIVAGAGTGKTYVLTEKIKKIILEKRAEPQEVLALTFTEKSAREMEERVDKALPYGYFQTWIMTFHSFADTILREHGVHIGISPTFKILTQVDATMFFRNNLHFFKLKYFYSTGNPTGFVQSALTHFSRLRDENVTSEMYLKLATRKKAQAETNEEVQEAEKTLELAGLYRDYELHKLKHNYLDFSDLIFYLVQLLTKRKNVLKVLRKQFAYCLVDEFQDTNTVQYDLLKLLFPPSKKTHLFVIGDDNQSIYKFRGASVSNILNFKKDYKDAKMFVLTENYRSYQEILDTSYRLITNNNPDTLESTLGINKKLSASRGSSTIQPEFMASIDGDEEGEKTALEIQKLCTEGKFSYKDVAILVRANDHAKPFIQALERYEIPFQFLGPALLYYKNEVRDLIAYLKFLFNPSDSTSLYRVLAMPIFSLDRKDLVYLITFAKRISRSLFESLDALSQIAAGSIEEELNGMKAHMPFLKEESKSKILQVFTLLESLLTRSQTANALQLVYDFLEGSGYLKELSHIKNQNEEEGLANITKFFNRLKKIEGEYGEPTVTEAVTAINLSLELGDSPMAEEIDGSGENAVNILTVHGAKGLEFPVVFLVSLSADRFPTRNRQDQLSIPDELIKEILPSGDAHVQEERRLFYVGMTRARDRLFLTFANYYGNAKRKKKVSPFIVESLGDKVIAVAVQKEDSRSRQLSIFEFGNRRKQKKLPEKNQEAVPGKFSYSQLETYETCSLQYKYRYMLKIPEPDSPALSFGSSIHKALELFYKDIKEGIDQNETDLLQKFRRHFIPLGYMGKEQRENAISHGNEILTNFFEKFHKEHGEVVAVEQFFTLKLPHNDQNLIISGKIDRIDKKGSLYEIIDYKTGKMPKESELKKSLQLGIYSLAAMSKELLGISQDKIRLTYYYLDKQEKFSVLAAERNLNETKEHIAETIGNLENGTFEPTVGRHCDWCPFKIICPAWET
ncbi:MAG: ATP-dependent DNA helicase [Patescibacteria group bacterium]|jgi:DNA helicase-2/ATP-dependent DNA helicase PcrA